MESTDDSTVQAAVLHLFDRCGDDLSRPAMLRSLVPELLKLAGADRGGLVVGHGGDWAPEGWVGATDGLPSNLISDAIDSGTALSDPHGWHVAPLTRLMSTSRDPTIGSGRNAETGPPIAQASAIVLHSEATGSGATDDRQLNRVALITKASELLATSLLRHSTDMRQKRRIEQLNLVLQASVAWSKIDDDHALLQAIADTACELVNCERASIFLWDRRRGKLVGRPALGIEGGALEVDDDAGVVGEVLATSETRLWCEASDQEDRVNRSVDVAQAFETRSLVAVPMLGSRGQLIGVFEAINHHNGSFDSLDAAVLTDLSMHSSVAIEFLRSQRSLAKSRDRLVEDAASTVKLIGQHSSIEHVRQNAGKVAGTDLTVLVLGKNGTGKEVLARHIHYESKRRSGPFIAVNCAALVESLLESELFGHEKGAFTDAQSVHVGKFELAHGGTLFLDEVGDMSPGGQAKLLRVLEEKIVVRVGGSQSIPVDVRVIAATNQPLESLIQQKRFREDLYFRLNVVSLTLPPLSERGDDVLLLAQYFMSQFCYDIGRPDLRLGDAAKRILMQHAWPGNVRELRNTIERVCYLTSGSEVMPEDLMLRPALGATVAGSSDGLTQPASGMADTAVLSFPDTESLSEATRLFQVRHIEQQIALAGGNMTLAAERLALHRSNLYRKMRQLGMPTSGE